LQVSENSQNHDFAETIFGYVDDNNKTARSGRVFFTDAKFESARDGIFFAGNPITPKVLASPKPTTVQHYLVQDKDKGHDPDEKKRLAFYATPSPDETVIRGHKMYWHKGKTCLEDIKEQDQEKIKKSPSQYTRIMPVKKDVTFSFRIYFDNLTDTPRLKAPAYEYIPVDFVSENVIPFNIKNEHKLLYKMQPGKALLKGKTATEVLPEGGAK